MSEAPNETKAEREDAVDDLRHFAEWRRALPEAFPSSGSCLAEIEAAARIIVHERVREAQ